MFVYIVQKGVAILLTSEFGTERGNANKQSRWRTKQTDRREVATKAGDVLRMLVNTRGLLERPVL